MEVDSAPVKEPISKASSRSAPEDTNSERLIITRMVLENFKSWGGVKEVGPFHKV